MKPKLVAQVKFTEWTDDNKLRHPTYLGLRDDKKPQEVVRGGAAARNRPSALRRAQRPRGSTARLAPRAAAAELAARPTCRAGFNPANQPVEALQLVVDQLAGPREPPPQGRDRAARRRLARRRQPRKGVLAGAEADERRSAPLLRARLALHPPGGRRPPAGDEALSQRRRRARRSTSIARPTAAPGRPHRSRGPTTTCRAASSADPEDAALSWRSWRRSRRTRGSRGSATPHVADHVAFDLDPMPGTSFDHGARRGAVAARRARDTSAPRVPEDVRRRRPARLRAAAAGHAVRGRPHLGCRSSRRWWPRSTRRVATVERIVRKRGAKVYVDYLQNIEGKTLACAYSARASEFAGASTPLTWKEIDAGLDRRDFTMRRCPTAWPRSAISGRGSSPPRHPSSRTSPRS